MKALVSNEQQYNTIRVRREEVFWIEFWEYLSFEAQIRLFVHVTRKHDQVKNVTNKTNKCNKI